MSQKFRFRTLDKVEQNLPKPKADDLLQVYEKGESRTIDLSFKDGTRQHFAYSHYITGWYGKDNDEWVIKLFFATHIVTIHGYCLEELYENITLLKVKKVTAYDERYLNMVGESDPFVTDIVVKWKNKDS